MNLKGDTVNAFAGGSRDEAVRRVRTVQPSAGELRAADARGRGHRRGRGRSRRGAGGGGRRRRGGGRAGGRVRTLWLPRPEVGPPGGGVADPAGARVAAFNDTELPDGHERVP